MTQNDNPSPMSYEINRFGDRINASIPTASFDSNTKRFRQSEKNFAYFLDLSKNLETFQEKFQENNY